MLKIIVDTVKHKVDITGESTNPAYIKRKDDSVATLNKGDTLSIENGESVNLLKGNFGFKMKIVETNSHESDSDLEDAPDPYVEEEEEKKPTTKRKNDDEDEERETKKQKLIQHLRYLNALLELLVIVKIQLIFKITLMMLRITIN